MAELTLYTNPRSRGRLARWMLEEVGADYEAVVLEYGEPMKSADYRAINPMGKVPAIVHRGVAVTEGAAICAYLADAFPEAGLAPPLAERGPYYRWLFFGAGPIEAAVTARGLKLEPPAEASGQLGYGSVALVVDTLEQALSGRTYITGEAFTAADLYVGAQVGWGMDFGLIEQRPSLVAFAERVRARPAYARASELDDATM